MVHLHIHGKPISNSYLVRGELGIVLLITLGPSCPSYAALLNREGLHEDFYQPGNSRLQGTPRSMALGPCKLFVRRWNDELLTNNTALLSKGTT